MGCVHISMSNHYPCYLVVSVTAAEMPYQISPDVYHLTTEYMERCFDNDDDACSGGRFWLARSAISGAQVVPSHPYRPQWPFWGQTLADTNLCLPGRHSDGQSPSKCLCHRSSFWRRFVTYAIFLVTKFSRKHFASLSNHTHGRHKCAGFWW